MLLPDLSGLKAMRPSEHHPTRHEYFRNNCRHTFDCAPVVKQELSMVEQAAGNFGEATTLRNLARSCNEQRREAMHKPALLMKGPPTLPHGSRRIVNETDESLSVLA